MVADFKLGAVGGKTRMQRARHAGTQVAAYGRGAHEGNARLLLLEQVDQYGGVGQRRVGIQTLVLHLIYSVHSVGEQLILDIFQIVAGHYSLELDAQLVGQRAALGEQLKAHVGHFTVLILAIYYEVVLV